MLNLRRFIDKLGPRNLFPGSISLIMAAIVLLTTSSGSAAGPIPRHLALNDEELDDSGAVVRWEAPDYGLADPPTVTYPSAIQANRVPYSLPRVSSFSEEALQSINTLNASSNDGGAAGLADMKTNSTSTRKVIILPLGDSITGDGVNRSSYRYPLWVKLVDAGIDFDFVGSQKSDPLGTPDLQNYNGHSFDLDHEGHGGWHVDQILEGLDDWLQLYTPDIVLLHAGTNDARFDDRIDDAEDGLKRIIDAIRADNPEAITLLAKLIPAAEPERNRNIKVLNLRIDDIASGKTEASSPVIVVDQNSGFSVRSDTLDGIHPNESGEEKMAQKWFDAIIQVLSADACANESEPIFILPLGDSITQANNKYRSYRYNLWEMLIDEDLNFDFVGSEDSNHNGNPDWPEHDDRSFDRDHEGHWGWKADQLLDNLPDWLTDYTPDIVLLHAGTNDIEDDDSVDSTVSDLEQMIDVLREDNASVVILLAKLIPTQDSEQNETIEELNDEIDGIAESKNTTQSPVIIVDQNEGFSVEDDTYDGTHPSKSGERKMAEKWYEAIMDAVDSHPCLNTRGTPETN
jgi:lysophospholipase L1-like esterase